MEGEGEKHRETQVSRTGATCHTGMISYLVMSKDVRQLVTAERHLPPKCTNFGFFTTKVYEFWVFYYQSVRILDLFMKLYEYWDVT